MSLDDKTAIAGSARDHLPSAGVARSAVVFLQVVRLPRVVPTGWDPECGVEAGKYTHPGWRADAARVLKEPLLAGAYNGQWEAMPYSDFGIGVHIRRSRTK